VSIDVDDASAALTCVATNMRPSQPQMIAQHMDKKRAILDIRRHRFAIHRQLDCRQFNLPKSFFSLF
jgi:hypothetical protein